MHGLRTASLLPVAPYRQLLGFTMQSTKTVTPRTNKGRAPAPSTATVQGTNLVSNAPLAAHVAAQQPAPAPAPATSPVLAAVAAALAQGTQAAQGVQATAGAATMPATAGAAHVQAHTGFVRAQQNGRKAYAPNTVGALIWQTASTLQAAQSAPVTAAQVRLALPAISPTSISCGLSHWRKFNGALRVKGQASSTPASAPVAPASAPVAPASAPAAVLLLPTFGKPRAQ